MLRWNNDYCCIAHDEVLKALMEHKDDTFAGYGKDEMCDKAISAIKKFFDCENADIEFFAGGTQANLVMIKSTLNSYQAVLSNKSGHIFCHECGAIENGGNRIIIHESPEKKIDVNIIEKELELYKLHSNEDYTLEPKLVYLSFPNEVGAIYTKKELMDIKNVCKKYGVYVYIDGARLGYGLSSEKCDVSPKDLKDLCDCFYIGGTKCGAMFGEAIVIINDDLKKNFRKYMKQNGAILAKGFVTGISFLTLFENNLYIDICRKADEQCMRIKEAFIKKGIKPYVETWTNQLFLVLDNKMIEEISKEHIVEFDKKIDENHTLIRFCTTWSTKDEDVDKLVNDISKL